MNDDHRLLTFKDAAELVGVSHETIRRWVNNHDLAPSYMPGSTRRRIEKKTLIYYVKKLQVRAKCATNESE